MINSPLHHHASYFLPALYTITDWLTILLAEVAAYELRNICVSTSHLHIAWMNGFIAFPLLFILFFRQMNVYQKRIGYWKFLEKLFYGCTYAIAAIVVLLYVSHVAESTSRLFIAFFWCFSFFFMILSRNLVNGVLNWAGVGRIPLLLVGAGKTARLLLRGIREDRGLRFQLVGYLDDAGAQQENVGDLPYLGNFSQAADVIRRTKVQDVIIAAPGLNKEALNQLLHKIQPLVRNISFVPDLIGLPVNGLEVETLFNERLTVMTLRNNLARAHNRFIKRFFDMVLTIIGGICLSPLFLLLAILIKADSKGPVFFTHTRIGKDGKSFSCLKFRTMCVDADVQLEKYLAANPAARKEWKAEYKLKDDPRVTRMGRILRRTSLDELPQLLNVLRGEMSLVGPRPIVTAEIPRYGEYIRDFQMVLPGITGMWQVNGRSDTTYEERVLMDSWYVRNWSVWLDIMLLWKTISVVLHHKGAY